MNKIKITLFTTLWLGALCCTHNLQAEEKNTLNATAELAVMRIQIDSINLELLAGKLGRIHAHVEAMNAALKKVENDSALDVEKKQRVLGYIHNIAKFSDAMHDAADQKKPNEAQKWAKKVSVQADLLEKQFKKGK